MHCRQYVCSVPLSQIARLSALPQEAQTMGFIERSRFVRSNRTLQFGKGATSMPLEPLRVLTRSSRFNRELRSVGTDRPQSRRLGARRLCKLCTDSDCKSNRRRGSCCVGNARRVRTKGMSIWSLCGSFGLSGSFCLSRFARETKQIRQTR